MFLYEVQIWLKPGDRATFEEKSYYQCPGKEYENSLNILKDIKNATF